MQVIEPCCVECGNGTQGIGSNQVLQQNGRILPDSGPAACMSASSFSLVAGSHIQHSDNRAAPGVVFADEVLFTDPATVVIVSREGALQVGSDESVHSRFVGNRPRRDGRRFLAEGGARRVHDSGSQLPDSPRCLFSPRLIPGLYEGGHYDECCRLFSNLLPLDNTYHIFGETQGIQCALLAASHLRRWNGVLNAYSVLTHLHAALPSSLLLVVSKVGTSVRCDAGVRNERSVEERIRGESGVDEETGCSTRREAGGAVSECDIDCSPRWRNVVSRSLCEAAS